MRSLVAGLAVLLGFLTGTAALGAYVAHRTVLEPATAGQAVDAALSDQALADRVLAEVVPGLGLPSPLIEGVRRVADNPGVHRAARRVTFDPRTGDIRLKPLQVELARQLRAHQLPTLADAVTARDAVITVPESYLTRYRHAQRVSRQVEVFGGLATLVLWVMALITSPRRAGTLRAIGLLLVLSCVLVGAVVWLSPRLVAALTSSIVGTSTSSIVSQTAAVAATAARPDGLRLLVPFAVAGVVLFLASLIGGRRGAR